MGVTDHRNIDGRSRGGPLLIARLQERWSALMAWIAKGRQRYPQCGG
ncbi:MAG: hypothetical protein LJE65_12230 [Desulfobacteraceae bacterium]|nr:hypothetical protein [Desulfobacteraceae bacterium]